MDLSAIVDAESYPLTGAQIKALHGEIKSACDRAAAAEKAVSDKTAGDKGAGMDKVATDVAALLLSRGMISAPKHGEVKAALAKDGGVLHYMKFALDLHAEAKAKQKLAEEKATQAAAPVRIGKAAGARRDDGRQPAGSVVAAAEKAAADREFVDAPENAEHRVFGSKTSAEMVKASAAFARRVLAANGAA
jgi:hypothetical protein